MANFCQVYNRESTYRDLVAKSPLICCPGQQRQHGPDDH